MRFFLGSINRVNLRVTSRIQLIVFGVFVSAFMASSLAAAPLIKHKLDSSFTVKGHFEAEVVDGKTVHPVISYHKVIQHEGKPYVCAGFKVGVRFPHAHEFFRQITLKLGSKTLRRGMEPILREIDYLSLFSKSLRVLSGDVRSLYGTEVECLRVNRKWRDEFNSAPSELFFPSVVWVFEG